MYNIPAPKKEPSIALSLQGVVKTGIVVFLILFASGCSSKVYFNADFTNNPNNQPPTATQKVGTVNVEGPTNSVVVVSQAPALPGKWIKVNRSNNSQAVPALQGVLSETLGNGTYLFTSTLFIPDGSGVATIHLESFNQAINSYGSLLHIDFLENNRIRLDDDASTVFGSFPRNQPFILQVTLNISSTATTAGIVLSGDSASGQTSHTIAQNPFSKQFSSVKYLVGFPWIGSFNATNIVVRQKQ
jgi:hypothetical protein